MNGMSDTLYSLFNRLTHGVYVVGVADGVKHNAFTAAWLMQTSFKPLLVALCINPRHSSYAMLKNSGVFSINVLKQDQQSLARYFGRPAERDKLAAVRWRTETTGAPIIADALAWFDCRLHGECAGGDHRLVLGRVVDGAVLDAGAVPLGYRDTGDMDGARGLFPDAF